MKLSELLESARKLGDEHGAAAGEWVTDGDTEPETYVKLLRGIEDCDPEVMDALPSAPLSGEWADGLTPRSLLRELGEDDDTVSAETQDAICTEYELAFNAAVERVVVHTCQHQLEG